MGIGNKEAQAKNRIKKTAEEKGWNIDETPKGILRIDLPLSMEVDHNQESTGGYKGTYEYRKFYADALRYKISWVSDWVDEGNPLSLRKVYMRNGKETKQNLLARLPDARSVIDRIELNYPKELKKAEKYRIS